MKREILFRGKRKDNGEWVYGYFYEECGATYIIEDRQKETMLNRNTPNVITPETIGQFTGLTDKNGVKIFEGDILLSESWGSNARSKRKTHIVEWGRVGWLALGYNGDVEVKPSLDVKSDWQVIGNIYDNPELLK